MNEPHCSFFLNGWFSVRLRILLSTWHWEEPFSFGKLKIPLDNILLFAHVCAFNDLPVLGPACNQIQSAAEVAVWCSPAGVAHRLSPQPGVCRAAALLPSNFSSQHLQPTLPCTRSHKSSPAFSKLKDKLLQHQTNLSLCLNRGNLYGEFPTYFHVLSFQLHDQGVNVSELGWYGWGGGGGRSLADLSHEECCPQCCYLKPRIQQTPATCLLLVTWNIIRRNCIVLNREYFSY